MGHRLLISPFVFFFFFISVFALFKFPKSPPTNQKILGTSSAVQIGLVGDLGLGRTMTTVSRRKNNFNWIFSGVSNFLKQNDFTYANLESPIVKDCRILDPYTMVFCGDPRFLTSLKDNKFVLGLANNHIFNYGKSGFSQTTTYLSQENIPFVYSTFSDPKLEIQQIKDIKFGFLSFDLTDITVFKNRSKITDLVKNNNDQVDWLIVGLHWGREYQPSPDKWQVDFAHQLVDAGADIIAGSHPHVFQDYETYQDRPIYYSLGNFIFDQNWSRPTSTSNIVTLTLTKEKIIKFDLTPIIIKYNSRPEFK